VRPRNLPQQHLLHVKVQPPRETVVHPLISRDRRNRALLKSLEIRADYLSIGSNLEFSQPFRGGFPTQHTRLSVVFL
jgi:hypothetical protein